MTAELQRTNPAELLYAEDFGTNGVNRGDAGIHGSRRCGSLRLIPPASS